jgi:hypothetical protein
MMVKTSAMLTSAMISTILMVNSTERALLATIASAIALAEVETDHFVTALELGAVRPTTRVCYLLYWARVISPSLV